MNRLACVYLVRAAPQLPFLRTRRAVLEQRPLRGRSKIETASEGIARWYRGIFEVDEVPDDGLAC